MGDQHIVKSGKDELSRGMPIDAMVCLMQAMQSAGMTTRDLMSSNAIAIIEDGAGIDPDADPSNGSAISTDKGLALFLPPGSRASILRNDGRKLHFWANIEGDLSCNPNAPFTAQLLERDLSRADPLCAAWLERGERGSSSESLCRLFFGLPSDAGKSHPHDANDFRRCVLFLEATGTSHRIAEAASLSEPWAKLASRWDELCSLLSDDLSSSGNACNAAMSSILRPAPKNKP